MTEAGSISDEGTWYHNVITQDGVEPKLYVNGVESTPVWETTTDKTLWMAGNSGLDKLTLGCTQWNGAGVSDCAKIYVDEFSLWEDVLTAEEVAILHSNKNLQDLPTVTTGTATTTVAIADSSGVHEIGGQFTTSSTTGAPTPAFQELFDADEGWSHDSTTIANGYLT